MFADLQLTIYALASRLRQLAAAPDRRTWRSRTARRATAGGRLVEVSTQDVLERTRV